VQIIVKFSFPENSGNLREERKKNKGVTNLNSFGLFFAHGKEK